MKCINCNKTIPNTSITCPVCGKDPNMKEDYDFGKVNDKIYNDKLDLKVMIEESVKKNKKIPIILAVMILVIVIVGIMSFVFKSNDGNNYYIYKKVVRNLTDKLEEKLEGISQGKYLLELNVNNDSYIFNGDYSYDLSNRYVTLSGVFEDPIKKQGGIIFEDKDFNFNSLLQEASLYFDSRQISDKALYFPLDNIKLYLNKKVDYTTIVNSVSDALIAGFKSSDFKVSKATYKNTNVTKTELVLDNKMQYNFFKGFYETLLDDSSFISEIKKITSMTDEQIMTTMSNYISNYEHAANENDSKIIIYIYSKGSSIYEINFDNKYIYNNSKDGYQFKYIDEKGNENVYKITTNSEEHQDYIEKTYGFIFTSKNTNINGTLKLKENIEPNLNKVSFEESTNVLSLDDEKKSTIKSSLDYYFKNSKFVDPLLEGLKDKCSKDLKCTCDNDKNCVCIYNNSMITCNYDIIN